MERNLRLEKGYEDPTFPIPTRDLLQLPDNLQTSAGKRDREAWRSTSVAIMKAHIEEQGLVCKKRKKDEVIDFLMDHYSFD